MGSYFYSPSPPSSMGDNDIYYMQHGVAKPLNRYEVRVIIAMSIFYYELAAYHAWSKGLIPVTSPLSLERLTACPRLHGWTITRSRFEPKLSARTAQHWLPPKHLTDL